MRKPDLTSQQSADNQLAVWQANRHLTPRERMEILFFDFLLPPAVSETEYDAVLRDVAEEMAS
jgi:hypothetical protein